MRDSTARKSPKRGRLLRGSFLSLAAVCLMTAGCSGDPFGRSGSSGTGTSSSTPSSSLGDRISNMFRNKPAGQDQSSVAPTAPPQDFDCPSTSIRQGASTFSVSAPGVESNAMSLRYQATFGQLARECQLIGTTLKMRVGVEGRIIVGPAGGPGQIDLPLRLAVVREGPEPKVITTKLIWITVAIPGDQPNVPFSQIEDDFSFPMPLQKAELEDYIVYVGFDIAAVRVPEPKSGPKKPASKPRR